MKYKYYSYIYIYILKYCIQISVIIQRDDHFLDTPTSLSSLFLLPNCHSW